MFYVGPNGLIVTGTLNWYNGIDANGQSTDVWQWYVVNDMLSCIGTARDDWLHDGPGEDAEKYFDPWEQCERACNVWNWAGWEPRSECISTWMRPEAEMRSGTISVSRAWRGI